MIHAYSKHAILHWIPDLWRKAYAGAGGESINTMVIRLKMIATQITDSD
jgi:hypothetical protein